MIREIFYSFIAMLLLFGVTADPVFSSSFPVGNENNGIRLIQEGGHYFDTPVQAIQNSSIENTIDIQSTQGTVVGESVILSSTKGDIIVTPHTLTASGWVKVDFLSKSITGPIDVSFGFLNTTQNIQVSQTETWESYAHNLTRMVDTVAETTFIPERILTKTAIVTAGKVLDEKLDSAKVDIGNTDLNTNIDTITFESTSPMNLEVTESTQTIAYTSEKDGIYTYRYATQVAEPYVETYADWKPATFVPKVETKSLANATKWNTLPGTRISVKNAWYSTRFWVEIPFAGLNEISGKYNIAIKSAGSDLSTSIILDPWYNSSWLYQKSIGINCTTNQTNYQMKLLVGYNSTAVGENVDTNSHCNLTTFDDLRFTTSDAVTLMPYWIESINATAPYNMATVWVNVTSISSANTTVIYMYYGNAGASAVSSGTNTFGANKFDDFEDYADEADISNTGSIAWTKLVAGTSTAKVDTSQFYSGSRSLRLYYDGTNIVAATFSKETGTDYAIRFMLRKDTNAKWLMYHGGATYDITLVAAATEAIQYYDTDYRNCSTPTSVTADAWGIFELTDINHATPKFDIWFNGTKIQNDAGWQTWGGDDGLIVFANAAGTSDGWMDNVIIRKWTANEPTWSSFGAEEAGMFGPGVTTLAAAGITNTTAILGGNITAMGSGNVSQYGIQYGTSNSYGNWINSTEEKTAVFSFTNTTTGLTPGLGYYFKSFANGTVSGMAYSSESTFLTAPNPPNTFATAIINSTALNLTWVAGTGATNVTVRYNTTGYPTNITGISGTTIYNGPLSYFEHASLSTGTPYYYSAWSITSNSTLSLTQYSTTNTTATGTPNVVPTVATIAATSITNSTAVLGGNITNLGGANVNYFGFQYGTSGAYGSTINNTGTVSTVSYPWTNTTSGLTPGDAYYFRSFAQNVLGIGYGSQSSFITIPNAPSNFNSTSITPTAVNLTWITATCGAGATVYTFVRYSTVGYPILTNGTALCNVSTSYYDGLSGLTPGFTYYFTVWTQVSESGLSANSTSVEHTSFLAYGNPSVTGYTSSSLTATTITSLANITNTGGINVTVWGAQYGTATGTYTDWTNQTGIVSTVPYPFTNTMSGLTAGQAYYYRAFTVNLAGFGNGTEFVNVTKPYLPTVFTATVTTPTSVTLTWTASAVAAGSVAYTYIRYQENTYPTTPYEGTLLLNSTALTTTITTLTPGHSYYFSAWGLAYDTAANLWSTYSDTYATIYATPSYATGYTGPAKFEGACNSTGTNVSVYGARWVAQTFNVTTDAHTVNMVKLKLLQTGNCLGVTVAIKRTVAGLPYGPDIGTGTLTSSVISTTDWAWYDFDITPSTTGVTDVALEASTQYAIIVSAMAGTAGNSISVFNSTVNYTGGSLCTSIDGSYTWIATSQDICFEIWGYPCLEMMSAKVYSSYVNSGDWLVTCHFRNVYPPYFPAQDPKQYFVLQIMHNSDVIAQSSVQKFGYMPGSIYMSAATVMPLEWGHEYRMRITGTYANAPYAEQILAPGDWIGPDLVRLDSYLVSVASLMETYYSSTFTDWIDPYGQIFNVPGGVLFSLGIPYLMSIRPNLFMVSSTTPAPVAPPTGTQQLKTQYTWTTMLGPYVSSKLTQVGEPFGGIDGQTVGAIFTVIVYIIVAGFAFVAGQSGAAIFLAFPIFLGGGLLGIIPLAVMFVALAIASFLLIYHFWLGRA